MSQGEWLLEWSKVGMAWTRHDFGPSEPESVSLEDVMTQAKHWQRMMGDHTWRIRNVATGDVVMADVL
jgi:hypothetical protein